MRNTEIKFQLGDKVRLNKRAPQHVQQHLGKRTRTIVGVHYTPCLQGVLYDLGTRGKGDLGYSFRGYMLNPVAKKESRKIGRPTTKRKYTKGKNEKI